MNMLTEEWRPIDGYLGKYEVSNHGRVRALLISGGPKAVQRRRATPLVLRPRPAGKGYMAVGLYDGHRIKEDRYVHRLVLEAFVGPCPFEHETRHYDGVKTNNRLDNISWATKAINAADKLRHGAQPQGTDHPLAKLTDEVVAEARRLHASGVSLKRLAEKTGVNFSVIRRAVQRTSWKHVS